jgi:hypothetical protein
MALSHRSYGKFSPAEARPERMCSYLHGVIENLPPAKQVVDNQSYVCDPAYRGPHLLGPLQGDILYRRVMG